MALAVRNLCVSRGGTRIVDNLSLSVARGELLMVLGPNGAGKSTLLKALAGELPATGVMTLAGRSLSEWHPRQLARHRAVMPQRVDVNFPLTVEEVVAMGRPRGLRHQPDPVPEQLMAELDIGHLRHRLVPGLSGGEQQRLQLARVLGQILDTPGQRLLLLDECTSALDPAHQQLVLELIRTRAKEHGIAVLAIVHDLNLAAQFADRLMVMRAGRRLCDGVAQEVLTPAVLEAAYGFRARVMQLPEGYPIVVPVAKPSGQVAPLNPSCRQAS
ncbi:MAG TPA: heme ABC transporter ATP-binding protein [Marinobacter sp.]|nr:heme ABC transporter ATP-binding protein [Marinobacter sp.]